MLVLVVALVLRLTLAERPLRGLSPGLVVAATALAAFAAWSLASSAWSGAACWALPEYDRALAYALGLVALGIGGRTPARLAWATRLVLAAIVAACVVGALSRLLPDLVHAPRPFLLDRLSYPLTYWNAQGIFAAVGLVLAFSLTTSAREPLPVRVLGAACVPLLATTLLLTFSRGALVAAVVGLVVALVAGGPEGWIGGIGAAVAGVVAPLAVLLTADTLSTARYLSAAGRAEGRDVVLALVAWNAAGSRAAGGSGPARHARAVRRAGRSRMTARTRAALWAGGVAALCAIALALGGVGFAHRQFDRFVQGDQTFAVDQRDRLLDPGNNGRLENWRVALEMFSGEPVHGTGAGTYQTHWERERRTDLNVVDGHSLYLEVLGEMGIVGLAPRPRRAGDGAVGLRQARTRPGSRRARRACWRPPSPGLCTRASTGTGEMPATGFWLFALGGLALAAPRDGAGPERARRLQIAGDLPRVGRVAAALACLVLAVVPFKLIRYERALSTATTAFYAGDCGTGIDRALDAAEAERSMPGAFELLGYCDVRLGNGVLAVRNLQHAVTRDPDSWEPRYGLALVLGAEGRDPLPAARQALARNPREPLARQAVRAFARGGPRHWERVARRLLLPQR